MNAFCKKKQPLEITQEMNSGYRLIHLFYLFKINKKNHLYSFIPYIIRLVLFLEKKVNLKNCQIQCFAIPNLISECCKTGQNRLY